MRLTARMTRLAGPLVASTVSDEMKKEVVWN